jgi:nucleosome binding factor SPN SPT16 subunit
LQKKNLEPLQEWLSETNTEWYQQTVNVNWVQILKHVEKKGYDEFIKTEGWAKLLEIDQSAPETKGVAKNNKNNTNSKNQVQTRQEESSRPKREASKAQPQTIATLGDDSSTGSDFSAGSDVEEEEEEDDIEESDD